MRLALVLGIVAVLGFAAAARAEIVHYINPAPGEPGHYGWRAEIEVLMYLDITAPAEGQTNTANGNSVGQAISGDPAGGTFGVLIGGAEFAVAAPDYPAVWGLAAGDPLSGLAYASWGGFPVSDPPESRFPEGERRYLGVRTAAGSYGWIEVERTGLSFAAFAWAYETVSGVPVFAGQIPAPGAMSLLAVGVLASSRRRRP